LLIYRCKIPALRYEFLDILLVNTASLKALEMALNLQLFRNPLDLFFYIVRRDPQPVSQRTKAKPCKTIPEPVS
jgi:hypothetical protein